jgi:DNA polymerase-3 subunit epsilon
MAVPDRWMDALCRRLGVDNSMRRSHNAVLDCQLLAQVYLEMMGGKQPGLELAAKSAPLIVALDVEVVEHDAVVITPSAEAVAAHEMFVSGKVKEALWLKPPFSQEGNS